MADPENSANDFGVAFLKIFDKRVTLGNLITIVLIIVYGTLFYAKVEAHFLDHTRHISEREFLVLFDSRFELLSKPMMTEFRMSNASVERQLQELRNELRQTRRELGQ